MVNGAGDQHERLAGGAGAVVCSGVEWGCVRRRWAPRVLLSVDEGETRVGDAEAAPFVNGVGVGRGGDVEGVDADYALVLKGVRTRYQWELVFRSTRPGLEVAPFRTVLCLQSAVYLRGLGGLLTWYGHDLQV